MDAIKIENLYYKYPIGQNDVLKNINLTVKKGEFYAVIGKNGSGKTTLCNAIRGFIPHFHKGDIKGEVYINGKAVSESDIGKLSLEVGFVFQNPFTQISGIKNTVFEEIAFGLENLGIEKNEIIDRVNNIIDLLDIRYLAAKNPNELSGGQKQRVALASIVVMEPDILVIDEPTSQLDPLGTEEVFKIIKLMKEKGKTIVLVEHKIDMIAEYADKVVFMDNGEILLDGTVDEVLTNPIVLEKKVALPQYAILGIKMEKEGFSLKKIPINLKEAEEVMKPYLYREV